MPEPPVGIEARAVEILVAAGAEERESRCVVAALAWADRRGTHAQGLRWVEPIAERLRSGSTVSPARHRWSEDATALHRLDAGDSLGHVAADSAAERSISLASAEGVGVVAVRASSHFGACGRWAQLVAEAGFVGLVATNSFPKVAAHGGRQAVLGTNPLGLSAPRTGSPPVVLDLSSGALAGSRVREARAAGRPLPEASALDSDGNPTTDPARLESGGVMLPAAGPKGTALALMVEILTSGLAGGAPPRRLGSMFGSDPASTSHVVISIRADGALAERVRVITEDIASGAGDGSVRIPGDRPDGVPDAFESNLPADTIASLDRIAARVGVES